MIPNKDTSPNFVKSSKTSAEPKKPIYEGPSSLFGSRFSAQPVIAMEVFG